MTLTTTRDGNNMQSKIQEGTFPIVLKYLLLDTVDHKILDLNLLAFLYARMLFQDILESFGYILMVVLPSLTLVLADFLKALSGSCLNSCPSARVCTVNTGRVFEEALTCQYRYRD